MFSKGFEIFISLLFKDWLRSFDNRFEVNRPPEPTLVLRWISKFFLFGTLPGDTLKIKHTKNLKEIPSRHFLENLLEKSKHSCLYTSETHWQFTGILPIYNGRHAKFHNSKLQKIFRDRFSRPLKLIFFKFSQFSTHLHIPRVCGKLPKVIIIQQNFP